MDWARLRYMVITMYEKLPDPSQLLALHFLLEERNVSQAAARMSISQSSMSHRLARLRQALGDPLLVRSGRSLVATRRAESMATPLAAAVRSLEEALAINSELSPRDLRGRACLYMPDLLAPLLPAIARRVRREAPELEMEVQMVPGKLAEVLGEKRLALALAPVSFASPQLMSRKLGTLDFAVVGRKGHPALLRRLTVKGWLEFGHMVVEVGNVQKNPVEEALQKKGLHRDVALRVPSFLTALVTVASSDYLMTAPRSLVLESMKSLPLQISPSPIPIPRVTFSMLWHERHQQDPAHEWLRHLVHKAVEPIVSGS